MSSSSNAYDFLVKILIVGDSGTGKTCLLLRFCEDSFTISHLTTIGINFKMKTIDVDGKKVKAQVWDSAGQERFKTITQTYYRGAMGIILVYAVNDRESFQNIENWLKNIKEHASENVRKILIGNKSDMPDRCVSTDEGKKLAESHGMKFFETSAKDSNVNDAFCSIFKDMEGMVLSQEPIISKGTNKVDPICTAADRHKARESHKNYEDDEDDEDDEDKGSPLEKPETVRSHCCNMF